MRASRRRWPWPAAASGRRPRTRSRRRASRSPPRHSRSRMRVWSPGAAGRGLGAEGCPPPPAVYAGAVTLVPRVGGVGGGMLVWGEEGMGVAERLREGTKGPAVAALAASLATRLGRAMEAAGVGGSQFWHLQAEQGALLVVPTAAAILVVAVAEPDVNVGMVRLELQQAAEAGE